MPTALAHAWLADGTPNIVFVQVTKVFQKKILTKRALRELKSVSAPFSWERGPMRPSDRAANLALAGCCITSGDTKTLAEPAGLGLSSTAGLTLCFADHVPVRHGPDRPSLVRQRVRGSRAIPMLEAMLITRCTTGTCMRS